MVYEYPMSLTMQARSAKRLNRPLVTRAHAPRYAIAPRANAHLPQPPARAAVQALAEADAARARRLRRFPLRLRILELRSLGQVCSALMRAGAWVRSMLQGSGGRTVASDHAALLAVLLAPLRALSSP